MPRTVASWTRATDRTVMGRYRRMLEKVPGWQWLLLGLALVSFFMYLWTPMYSDDLVYKGYFSGVSPRYGSWTDFPRHVAAHYLYANGRLVDKFMPLFMNLPGWLLAGLSALGWWSMCFFSIRASGASRGCVPFVLTGAFVLLLPWWDYMCLFVMQCNYVWVTALVMASFSAVFSAGENMGGRRLAGLAFLCFVAGMSHEGAAVPLLFGYIVYLAINRRMPGMNRRILMTAFAAGALATMLSPGMWGRVKADGAMSAAEALNLVLVSEPVVVALWAGIVLALPFRRGRALLAEAFRGSAGVLLYATLAGAPIILASGMNGRSGWFVTVYALVAVASVAAKYVSRPLRGLQWAIGILLIAQGAGMAWIQRRLYREYMEFEEAYVASPDGVVRGDFTMDDELPVWTLHRLRGVPDGDDLYLRETLCDYFRTDSVAPTVIFPSTRIVTELPEGVTEVNCRGIRIWIAADSAVYQPLGNAYTEERRIIDPGD